MLSSVTNQPPDFTLTADASGSWDCGAFAGLAWFQLEWADMLGEAHIAIKELVSIVIVLAVSVSLDHTASDCPLQQASLNCRRQQSTACRKSAKTITTETRCATTINVS